MRDKLDWHASAAIEAGQPEEHGFVHIACFLHWLAKRGWLEPWLFSKVNRARIAEGSIDLDELIDLTDLSLTNEMATSEGAAFGDARYDTYLERWTDLFPGQIEYSIPWTAETRARANAVLDELYAAWHAEGAPRPALETSFAKHQHPEIEHLVPTHIDNQLLKIESFDAAPFGLGSGHPLVVGIDASSVAVAGASHRMFRSSSDSVAAWVVVVPGRSAAEIASLLGGGPVFPVEQAKRTATDGIDVGIGRFREQWIAWWSRDERFAQVVGRTRKRVVALVRPTDMAMTRPATVIPAPPPTMSAAEIDAATDAYLLHHDRALEALLPSRDRPGSLPSSFRFGPGERAGVLWPGHPGGTDASVTLDSGCTAHLIRIPGADPEQMAVAAARVREVPSEAVRSNRVIGGRDVMWFRAGARIAAIWLRGDLICSVGGQVTEAALLEAIERMP